MDPQIYQKVANKLDLPIEVVKAAYNSFWLYIKNNIQQLSLRNISETEFNRLSTSFNLPSLGKIYSTYKKVLGTNKSILIKSQKYAQNKKNNPNV